MNRFFLMILSIFLATGCSRTTRNGVLSPELPLTLDDIAEIRAGEQNHEHVLWEHSAYDSPKLEQYCNAIAASLAEVSTRPNLPYRVTLLDEDEVNIFGGPGGSIYLSRGLLNFVRSEAELAGVIAHEITHVANYEYSAIPQISKVQKVYGYIVKGTELATETGAGGPYAKGAEIGVKAVNRVAPAIGRRFSKDQEIETDKVALETLIKAGYDPRGYYNLIERLSKIEMDEIPNFVNFMNTHPPFYDRRVLLQKRIQNMDLEKGKIEFKKDLLSEVRQATVNAPQSIIFEPDFATPQVPLEVNQMEQEKEQQLSLPKKRWAWS